MIVRIIRTSGAEELIEMRFSAIAQAIGADAMDTVNLRDGRVMLVDDNGWEYEVIKHSDVHIEHRPIRARKPINDKATALYRAICLPGTTHAIAGDVAIVIDAEVDA